MKRSKVVYSRRGITLVELLLASVITVLVIGAAGTALILGFRMFNATAQTAQEQREIKLVESALKDSLQTAISVEFRNNLPEGGDDFKHYLYFDADSLVMFLGKTKLDTGNIQSVTVTLQTNRNVSYAKYAIITGHITYNGVVVMNNVPVDEITNGATTTLSSGSSNVFGMKMPDPDDPFND